MSLRAQQFEAYLNWILSNSGMLDDNDFVSLCDQPPLDLQKDIVNTKNIEFHAPVSFEPIGRSKNNGDTKSVAFRPSDIGWDVLKKILPPEMTLPKKLQANEVMLNKALEVTLKLSWSRLDRSDPTYLLDRISNQLRHVDTELDYTIETRSGKITRDDFKLRRTVSVKTDSEGLVRKSYMWERIEEWLEILITEDKISLE